MDTLSLIQTPEIRTARSPLGNARRTTSSRGPTHYPRLHGQQALALQFLARELAGAANGFRFLSDLPLGGFLVVAAELHLAEYTLALHLLLQHLEGLIDVVVAYEDLHERFSRMQRFMAWRRSGRRAGSPRGSAHLDAVTPTAPGYRGGAKIGRA